MFVGATAVSTETTGCGTGETTGTASTLTYEIASSSQAANTQYTLKITSSHNAQITYIKYYKKTSGGGSTPSVSLNNTSLNPTCAEGDGTINVTYNNIASVDAEVKFYESDGMEIVKIATKQILMISGPDVVDDGTGVSNPNDIMAPELPGVPSVPGLPGMPSLFE